MKRFLLFLTVYFLAVHAFGQSPQVDSLKHRIAIAKGDKQKLRAMLDLCDMFETLPKDTLWNYAVRAKALATKLHDGPSRTLAIIAQANAYQRWNNADSARALIEPELLKYKAGNTATRDIYFQLRSLKIDCIATGMNYKDAIEDNYLLIREAEKYKDSLVIANCYNAISGYKYDMGFDSEPIKLGLKGMSYTSNTPRYYKAIINLNGNLAEYYFWVYKLDSAMYHANQTFNLARQIGAVYFEAWAWQKRSAIYVKTKEYDKSEKAILEAIYLDTKVNGKEPLDDNLIALADVYSRTKQYDKAIKAMTDGLAYFNDPKNVSPHANHKIGTDGFQRIFYYKILARNYHLKGDSKNYESTLERIVNDLDSVYTKNSAQAIADFETKYQVQKKEATIAQQQLSLVRENYLFYGSVVIAALGVIIAFLIFREVRRKQKLRLLQMQEEEKQLSEKAVADAEETERRRIAADLHDNLGAQLSFIKRNVGFIMDQPAGFSKDDERKYLSSVNDIAQTAMVDLRETLWVLNKDEVSVQEFADKLKSYLKQQLMGKDTIKWGFKEDIGNNWRLSSGEVMHLFRIVQEVISNIIKHAEAEHINVQFDSSSPDTYQLEIFDNGKGFDVSGTYSGHYGLENIQQRAKEISAKLQITSSPDAGTRMILTK